MCVLRNMAINEREYIPVKKIVESRNLDTIRQIFIKAIHLGQDYLRRKKTRVCLRGKWRQNTKKKIIQESSR